MWLAEAVQSVPTEASVLCTCISMYIAPYPGLVHHEVLPYRGVLISEAVALARCHVNK